jgi:hypothetical protein
MSGLVEVSSTISMGGNFLCTDGRNVVSSGAALLNASQFPFRFKVLENHGAIEQCKARLAGQCKAQQLHVEGASTFR